MEWQILKYLSPCLVLARVGINRMLELRVKPGLKPMSCNLGEKKIEFPRALELLCQMFDPRSYVFPKILCAL